MSSDCESENEIVSVKSFSEEAIRPPNDQEKRMQAAFQVSKVAVGFLTRKRLSMPESWMLRYKTNLVPAGEIVVAIDQNLTANQLRQILSKELNGINFHRIILHNSLTGLSSSTCGKISN